MNQLFGVSINFAALCLIGLVVGVQFVGCPDAIASDTEEFYQSAGAVASGAVAAGALKVEASPMRSFVLASVGQTCAMTRVEPGRIVYPQVKLTWSGSEALRQVTLILAFQHPNLKDGRFVCEIDGGEFSAAFGTSSAELKARSSLRNQSACALQCGGLQVSDEGQGFVATGTLTAAGVVERSSGRVRQPFQYSVPIELEYRP